MRSSACRLKSLNVFMHSNPAVRSRSYTLKELPCSLFMTKNELKTTNDLRVLYSAFLMVQFLLIVLVAVVSA